MKGIVVVLAVAVVLCLLISPGIAATPEEIEDSIDSGIAWLADQQSADGSWGSSTGAEIGLTGFALLKLEDYAYEHGFASPFDPDYEYAPNVEAGFDYLFQYYQVGDYDGDGIPDGYFDNGGGYHQTYFTAIALMSIASSGTPDLVVVSTNGAANGKTFQQIAEECVEWFSATQNSDGGWRYSPGQNWSDQSNTGWATMGLTYASVKFGTDIATVLPGLQNWVNAIQNKDDPLSSLYGGSKYTLDGGWENILKTGSLLYQFAMLGTPETDPDLQAAIGFIENPVNWNGGIEPGWDDPQAMFCMMKGLEAYHIEKLDLNGDTVPETDWFDVVSTRLVTTQNSDGSWPPDMWMWNSEISTAWALLTLEKTVIIPAAFEVDKSASAPVVHPTDTVTYTYLVKNTGIKPISGVILTDDKLGIIAGPPSGDNGNNILDKGEVWTYIIATTLPETTANTAAATGLDPDGNPVSTATSAVVTVTVINPGIAITKAASAALIAPGDPVTYTYTVTNTGDVPLTVTVTDSVLGAVTGPTSGDTNTDGKLDLTETWIYEATTNPNETVTNTATAEGTDPIGFPVSAVSDAVTVVVNRPPDTSGAKASINCLWPPDHKFVNGQVDGVTDPDNDVVTITVLAITSDEPTATDKGSGGAKHAPDASGVGSAMFSVRSERSGDSDGRVYMISFKADDGKPNGVSFGSVTVKVPHDQSKPNKPCQAVDSGQKYNATAIN